MDVFVERGHAQFGQVFDEAGPPFADVAVRAATDEPEPSMAEPGEMVDGGRDTAAVVDVDRRHAGERGALPHGDDRHVRCREVVEEARLIANVAEQHDAVAVAGLEDGAERDRLVGPAVGAPEHDVVVALARRQRHRLDGGGEERVGDLSDDDPEQHRLGAAQPSGQRVRPIAEPLGGLEHPLRVCGPRSAPT